MRDGPEPWGVFEGGALDRRLHRLVSASDGAPTCHPESLCLRLQLTVSVPFRLPVPHGGWTSILRSDPPSLGP